MVKKTMVTKELIIEESGNHILDIFYGKIEQSREIKLFEPIKDPTVSLPKKPYEIPYDDLRNVSIDALHEWSGVSIRNTEGQIIKGQVYKK